MSNLVEEIEAQIVSQTGCRQKRWRCREISDGVAKIEGLTDCMLNAGFGNGTTGLALNLEETEVGAIILGEAFRIKEGAEVKTTGKLLQVPMAKPC